MVIGSCAVDITSVFQDSLDHSIILHSSHPGAVTRTLGGVACNIARAASRLGTTPTLLSVVGDDNDGNWIRNTLEADGVTAQELTVLKSNNTAVYNAIHLPDGELYTAVADMQILDEFPPQQVTSSVNSSRL